MTSASTDTPATWRCPRCETVAAAGQRFCRQCGHELTAADGHDASGEIDRAGPAIRPVSRLLIALIVVLFLALGALAALLVDDIRHEPDQPAPTGGSATLVGASGTLPMTSTD